MTITTSKQLAEALGEGWATGEYDDAFCGSPLAVHINGHLVESLGSGIQFYGSSACVETDPYSLPRAAVLAMADELEAEAKALRDSVKEGGE